MFGELSATGKILAPLPRRSLRATTQVDPRAEEWDDSIIFDSGDDSITMLGHSDRHERPRFLLFQSKNLQRLRTNLTIHLEFVRQPSLGAFDSLYRQLGFIGRNSDLRRLETWIHQPQVMLNKQGKVTNGKKPFVA